MTQHSDLVSVIVPAYNAAATIGQTLQSCLAQTHRALEVVVVDDGSSDATAEIVRFFAARDRRVRLVQQENAGVAAARNLAIAHAKGAYIAPLDADDLWHPEKIALQVEAMRRGGLRVGVVYCWSRWIDELGLVRPVASVPYPHEGHVYAALITRNILENASTPLIRRARLSEIGGFDTSLREGCEDLRLYLQLAERCDFALVPRFLVGYRATRSNMSSNSQRMLRSHRYVLAEARRRHPELPGWLFRLGKARYAFYLAKPCFKHGKPLLGLILLIDAVIRDPAAVLYRLAEAPYRALSRYLRRRPAAHVAFRSSMSTVQTSRRPGARLLGYCAEANQTGPGYGARRSAKADRQHFSELAPEPTPGTRICSSFYAWRCEVCAVSIGQSRGLRRAAEG